MLDKNELKMREQRKELIEYLTKNGNDKTYDELAVEFNILSPKTGAPSGERVRSLWRKLKKKGKVEAPISQAIPTSLPNAKVKRFKEWQTYNGETRTSVEYDTSTNALEEFRKSFISEIKKVKPNYRALKRDEKKNPVLLEISLPDAHYGKGDPKEVEQRYFDSLQSLMSKVSGYEVERILLVVGNDGMNSEGMRRTTTKGTPQNDNGEWHELFRGFCIMTIRAIEYLRQFAPVDVIVVYGNHDYERTFYAGEVISAYFSSSSDITIDNNADDRKYYKYGQCMLMLTHGEKERPADMAMNMPLEQPEMFAQTKHREVHCGHFHKEMVLDEYKSIKVRFIPSICTQDEWHAKQGYNHYRTAQAFIWDANSGLDGFVQSNLPR